MPVAHSLPYGAFQSLAAPDLHHRLFGYSDGLGVVIFRDLQVVLHGNARAVTQTRARPVPASRRPGAPR